MLQKTFCCWQNALLMDTQGLQHLHEQLACTYVQVQFFQMMAMNLKTTTQQTRNFWFLYFFIFYIFNSPSKKRNEWNIPNFCIGFDNRCGAKSSHL